MKYDIYNNNKMTVAGRPGDQGIYDADHVFHIIPTLSLFSLFCQLSTVTKTKLNC